MRYALVTMMDANFIRGFKVFWKSFKHFNPWFDGDFRVIDVGLMNKGRKEVMDIAPDVKWVEVQEKDYAGIKFNRTAPQLQKTYYTFELFTLSEYDKVVFIDMDTVVLGDISELFRFRGGFGMCRCYSAKSDDFRDDYNSGVFVVNNQYLNEYVRTALINICTRGFSMPDQRAINKVFRNKIREIDKRYNVEKRMEHSEKYQDIYNGARILHFVGAKPWQAYDDFPEIERTYTRSDAIWREWDKR